MKMPLKNVSLSFFTSSASLSEKQPTHERQRARTIDLKHACGFVVKDDEELSVV
jgi:hypothetical protein